MDRAKFCKMLEIAKGYAGKTTSDISFDLRVLPGNVRRLERGLFNFRMDRCFMYLNYIGYHITLTSEKKVVNLRSNGDIIKWFKSVRGKKSRPEFAAQLGVDRSYIRLIESGANSTSIDVFLRMAELNGFEVTLTPDDEEE